MSSEFEKHSITYYARFLILFQYELLFCWVNVPPFFIRYNLASFFFAFICLYMFMFRIRCKLQTGLFRDESFVKCWESSWTSRELTQALVHHRFKGRLEGGWDRNQKGIEILEGLGKKHCRWEKDQEVAFLFFRIEFDPDIYL